MNRKFIPLIMMLVAGLCTLLIAFLNHFSGFRTLTVLLIVLLVFYLLGSILKGTLDYFEDQIAKREEEERLAREALEKEEQEAATQEQETENK